jgi:hypothetical protein
MLTPEPHSNKGTASGLIQVFPSQELDPSAEDLKTIHLARLIVTEALPERLPCHLDLD